MKSHLLRRALERIPAVAVCTLAVICAPALAGSRRTVVIGPGDSIDSLARKYHVSITDIARANHISKDALLLDGHKLIIPEPRMAAVRPATMHKRAWVNGDRVSVRLAPSQDAHRLTLLDHGAPLVATAKRGDWLQVKLSGGSTGWILSDFLRLGGSVRPRDMAAAPSHSHGRHRTASAADSGSRATAARRRTRVAARQHEGSHRRVARVRREHPRSQITRTSSRSTSKVATSGSDVVRTAYAYRGTPYRFGASGRRAFDCSGFTSYVYGRKGVNLPHSAAEQYNHGRRIDSGHLKEGDLVFFHTTRRGISHVGIYVGNGKFVHASSAGGRVRVDSLSSGYYKERFRGARRVR